MKPRKIENEGKRRRRDDCVSTHLFRDPSNDGVFNTRHIRVSFTKAAQKMTKMTNTLTLDDKELSSKLDSIVQVRNEVETADDSQCGREDY